MLNFTLYKREMKGSRKILFIFAAVLALYTIMVFSMYDPETINMIQQFTETMPEVMAAFGMAGTPTDLTGFVSVYLYGMLLLAFPMVFTILRANGLISRYVDRGSMVSLVAAPVKRVTIAFTQMMVLASGIFLMVLFCAVLEIVCSAISFPGELDIPAIALLNVGLLGLHLFIGGICFLASCVFSDTKYSIGFGAGIPAFMYVLQMLANTGGSAENMKYATFFTLFNPDAILAGETVALWGVFALFAGAVVMLAAAIYAFNKKDLHI